MAMKFGFLMLYLLLDGVFSCDVWMKGSVGSVTPNGDVIEAVGATVKIDCTLSKNSSGVSPGDSQQLVWKKNGAFISNEYVWPVDDYTAQLLMPNVTTNDTGSYHCLYNSSSGMKFVCYNSVEIGYPPLNVTDFSCVSPNWQYLECSFTSPNNPIRTKYELDQSRSADATGNCTLKREKNRYTCNITGDSTPIYSQVAPKYIFWLKASNKLGSPTFKFEVDHYSRVLPNAPVNPMATTMNSTVIEISWSWPKELKRFPVGLTCSLRYRSEWDADGNWSLVADIENNSVILNVVPYTNYTIKVKCRSSTARNEDGLWSPETTLSHRTSSDIPGQPPLLVPGSFQDKPSLDSRTVYIFWQTIPPYKRNGPDFAYQAIGSVHDKLGMNLSISPKDMKENYAVFDNLELESKYTFELYSINKEGRSADSSYLTIEKQSRVIPKPDSFTAIYFDRGIYELSWKASPDMKDVNYTLFWCNNIKPHPFHCQGNLSWSHVSADTSAYNISLPDEKVNYHFAIAADTKTFTSGMVWATCIIPYNGTLNKMKKIDLIPMSNSSIKVSWKLDCSERIGIVTGFNIYYCPIANNDTAASCERPEDRLWVNGSHTYKSLVSNLEPFTYYKVVVAAVTRAGEGEHSNGKIVRTHQSAPRIAATNITFSNKTDSSITFKWSLPFRPYGNIVKYKIIYDGNKEEYLNVLPNQAHFNFTLTNLDGFTNYTIYLEACISDNTCSPKTEVLKVRTDIGVPGVMSQPRIVNINGTHVILTFEDPLKPNGPIDYRNIFVTWEADGFNHSKQVTNITQEEAVFETRCGDPDVKAATLYFSSQAVNVLEGDSLEGPFSDPAPYQCFDYDQSYIVIIATLSTVGIVSAIGLIVWGCFRMKRVSIDIQKKIKINLPEGLQTDNFITDYPYKKRPKTKNAKELMNDANKLQDDNSRSRNTSGETRISTSSIDELLQRSKDVSGERHGDNGSALGSVSSTQTTRSNLSSDLSCSDANSLPPTTPDMVFLDNPMQLMKIVPEVEGTETESLKSAPVVDAPPASYSRFAQYQGGIVPSTVNGYIQTLPASGLEQSTYVAPNPPNNSSYSQVGLAAGPGYTNYPNGESNENVAAIQAAPTVQYSQIGLADHPAPGNSNQLGYSAVGLAKDTSLPGNGMHPGYVSAAMADLCDQVPSKVDDLCTDVKPVKHSMKPNSPANAYVPMRSHSENPSPMYSRVSLHQPSHSGYVPPSEIESAMDQPSVQSILKPVPIGLETVPVVPNKDITDTPSSTCTNKSSTPKKNGYVSLDMMEDKASCLNSTCPASSEIMKTSRLSDDLSESPGPYSRVVSMTFDEADNTSMAEDQS